MSKMKISKVWHNYNKWEDWHNGMYEKRVNPKYINLAKSLLSSPSELLKAMGDVVSTWSIATEENLTDNGCNKRAWLGHSACSLLHRATKIETCCAWAILTDEQRVQANKVADAIIEKWRQQYKEKLCQRENWGYLF